MQKKLYGCTYVAVTRLTASWYMHLLHWGSYKALWNVGLLIRGHSLLYCECNFKMAVCCGQSMDSLHPESPPTSELFRCVPHLFPVPIRCKGVTQSHCWLSLLCWHWSRTLLQVKAIACVRTQLLSWHAVRCVCFCIVQLSLPCLCVSWLVSRKGKGEECQGN